MTYTTFAITTANKEKNSDTPYLTKEPLEANTTAYCYLAIFIVMATVNIALIVQLRA